MKRYLTLAGIVLLVGVIFFFEEKSEVEPEPSRIASPELTLARMDPPPPATNGHFLDNIHITYEPMGEIDAADDLQSMSLAWEKDPPPASLGKIRPRLGDTRNPVLTVVNRQINYELFGAEGFTLKLNLTPAYANPTALIPSRLDPGVGVAIKF